MILPCGTPEQTGDVCKDCPLIRRITNKRKPFARDYDIHGHKLEEVESAKYLGVTIQKNLSWNIHIDHSAARLICTANGLRLLVIRKS
jgi:hypothetical protein